MGVPHLRSDDSGQDLAEYGILIALIALLVIAGLVVLAPRISQTFSDAGQALSADAGGGGGSGDATPSGGGKGQGGGRGGGEGRGGGGGTGGSGN